MIATATIAWPNGTFISVIAQDLLMNGDPGDYKYPWEQSIAHLNGYYASAWMEFASNRTNYRTLISWMNPNVSLVWGSPPATAVVPQAPFGNPNGLFTDQLGDPYVASDAAGNRFLLASLAQDFSAGHTNIWVSRTGPAGNWLTNGVSYSNLQVTVTPNSQPFLYSPGHNLDYPTVATRGFDGKIIVSALDVSVSGAAYNRYYAAVQTGSAADGTILFGAPVQIPVQPNIHRGCQPSRVIATYSKFIFFLSCIDDSTTPRLIYIDRYESANGTSWTGPLNIGWVKEPSNLSSYGFGYWGLDPNNSSPLQAQLHEPKTLDARGTATGERWSLVFPGSILNTTTQTYVNNIYHCNQYGCGINDYDPWRDQFMPGTSVYGDDTWTTYLSYSAIFNFRLQLKAMYGLPNGAWRVKTIRDEIDPGQWVLKGSQDARCKVAQGLPLKPCWVLGDYVHTSAAPAVRAMAFYPYYLCPTCQHPLTDYSSPVRLWSAYLEDPATPNDTYTPVTIRFPLGSDLTKGLGHAPPTRVSGPGFADVAPDRRWAGTTSPKPLKLCPKEGQVPLTGIPACPGSI